MFKISCLSLLFILANTLVYAQCTSSNGTPIINETFGSGTSTIGPPLNSNITNLQFVYNTCPNDGMYSIVNYTSGCYGNGWLTVKDHTGDPNGYFMLINASYEPSDFYLQTVNGLCEGTTYEFSSWILNMAAGPGGYLPNITFTIEKTDGTVLSSYNTGDVPVIAPAKWVKYGFTFVTPPGVSTVRVRMHNSAPGGSGNDLALDDIGFSPTGPATTIGISGVKGDTLVNACNKSINLFSTIGNCYVKNAYQWQSSTDGKTWTDIAGANSQSYTLNLQVSGTYYYRLNVAENGNISNVNCRTNSNVVTIIYTDYGPPPVNNISASVCEGSVYTLPSGKVVSGSGIFRDTTLNSSGCVSLITVLNLQTNPIVYSSITATICQGSSYLGYSNTAEYIDTLTAANGCDSIRILKLTVKPLAYSTINAAVCQGGSYLGYSKTGTYIDTLNAANGCDSVRTLNLTVKPIAYTTINTTICQGSSYAGYSKTGTYIDTLTGVNSCDSIRTLNLTVKPWSFSTLTATICDDTNYYGYNKTGTYIDTLTAASGCDSIRTLNLTVKPAAYSTINAAVCAGENYLGHTQSGTYIDTLNAANGCDSLRTINLTVYAKPAANLGKTNYVCYGDSLILNPGVFNQYLWQDGSTKPTYKVTAGGNYSVRVTDENGCTATDSIAIQTEYCSIIKIPNTFTPNADGINDTWDIYALQFYPDCTVYVFTRWGQPVFNSIGYPKPWDGTYKGKQLPVGTYYYIIDLKNNTPKLSGYITIIR